jgi:hypothetical protein
MQGLQPKYIKVINVTLFLKKDVSTVIEFNVWCLKTGTFLPTIFSLSINEVKKIVVIKINVIFVMALTANVLRLKEVGDDDAFHLSTKYKVIKKC